MEIERKQAREEILKCLICQEIFDMSLFWGEMDKLKKQGIIGHIHIKIIIDILRDILDEIIDNNNITKTN